MTIASLTGLIFAIAFFILVVGLVWFLVRLVDTLKIINKHVDVIGNEAQQIADNTNILLSDINSKSARVDPAIQAIGDLGQGISNLTSKKEKKEASTTLDSKAIINLILSLFPTASFASSLAKSVSKKTAKKRSTKKSGEKQKKENE